FLLIRQSTPNHLDDIRITLVFKHAVKDCRNLQHQRSNLGGVGKGPDSGNPARGAREFARIVDVEMVSCSDGTEIGRVLNFLQRSFSSPSSQQFGLLSDIRGTNFILDLGEGRNLRCRAIYQFYEERNRSVGQRPNVALFELE